MDAACARPGCADASLPPEQMAKRACPAVACSPLKAQAPLPHEGRIAARQTPTAHLRPPPPGPLSLRAESADRLRNLLRSGAQRAFHHHGVAGTKQFTDPSRQGRGVRMMFAPAFRRQRLVQRFADRPCRMQTVERIDPRRLCDARMERG